MTTLSVILLCAASFAAGIINTIAGGGSFLTFPSLLATGLDPRAASITSTLALFPMQVTSGFAGRDLASGLPQLSMKELIFISLVGGVLGAVLLLLTPPLFFARLIPWLILFATAIFAYGSFIKKPHDINNAGRLRRGGTALSQLGISIYGGYFGGGIGFLMLAALTLAGMSVKKAGATKNILAAVMNAAAVLIFLFSRNVGWCQAAISSVAAILGGYVGVRVLHRINERILRAAIVILGLILTVAMFFY